MDHTIPPTRLTEAVPNTIRLRFKEDSGDASLLTKNLLNGAPGYGNADFPTGGTAAPQTITLPFAATAMSSGGLRVPSMRSTGVEFGVDDFERAPRLLFMQGMRSGDWSHGGDDLEEYPRCYFTSSDKDAFSLGFGNIKTMDGSRLDMGSVKAQWAARLRRMADLEVLECHLFLKDHELRDFHHGIPTRVDDGSGPAWYYVQEIQDHRFGMGIPTKCILVRIPGKEVKAIQAAAGSDAPPITPGDPDFLGWDDSGSGSQNWDDSGSGTNELIDH